MRQQLLKVRLIEGHRFFMAPDGSVSTEMDGDNDSLWAAHERGCTEIEQTDYWLAKLEEARRERDREAIDAILKGDDMLGPPEGWVPL